MNTSGLDGDFLGPGLLIASILTASVEEWVTTAIIRMMAVRHTPRRRYTLTAPLNILSLCPGPLFVQGPLENWVLEPARYRFEGIGLSS
jgi:hypothetical protein